MDAAALLDGLEDLVFVIGPDGTVRYVNAALERCLRWKRDEWLGRSVFDVVHPDDLAGSISSLESLRRHEHGTPVELRVIDVDGGWHWVEVVGTNLLLDEQVGGLVCVARDITERRMWEVAGGDVARFQQVVQHAASITLLLDADGVVTSVSAAFARLLGHDPSVVVGAPMTRFVGLDHQPLFASAVDRIASGRRGISIEVPMTRANRDERRPMRFELVNLLDDPVVEGIVVSGYDVTDLQRARDELQHLAQHDVLTGLANRSLLLDGIERSLALERRIAVVFIDLDRFKPVNDLFGHETGDAVLIRVAKRLERMIRPGDLVARVGGDEFVVLAPNISTWSDGRAFADRIEAELSEPYLLDVGPVKIGASVGVAVSDTFSTVVSLLADADVQMYDAKSQRRGMLVRPAAERRRSAIERRRLADELAIGLRRGEVVAHLQPIVDLSSGSLVSMEALARWNHPTLGLLGPASFIDLVEDAGLDLVFGDAVLASAAETLEVIRNEGHHPTLAVNLSIGQLGHIGLTDRIGKIIAPFGLAMSDLVIEITERETLARHAAANASSPDDTLAELYESGAALTLDDFGTGHSSLTHVRRFPLASIKIDQTFVSGMTRHPQDLAVVNVVIGLAAALALDVVAEGVETTEQFEMLRSLGCRHGQGYLIAPPLDPATVVRWVDERSL